MTRKPLLAPALAAALLVSLASATTASAQTVADFPILPEHAFPVQPDPARVAKGFKPGGAKGKLKDSAKKEDKPVAAPTGALAGGAAGNGVACDRSDVQLVAPWNKTTVRFKFMQGGEVPPQEAPYRSGATPLSGAMKNVFTYWMGRAQNVSGFNYTQTASADPAVLDVYIYGTSALEGSGFDGIVTPVGGNSYVAIRATVAKFGSVPVGTIYHVGMGHELKHTEGFPDLTPDCFPSLQGDTMLFSNWNLDIDDAGDFYTTIPRYDRQELVENYGN